VSILSKQYMSYPKDTNILVRENTLEEMNLNQEYRHRKEWQKRDKIC